MSVVLDLWPWDQLSWLEHGANNGLFTKDPCGSLPTLNILWLCKQKHKGIFKRRHAHAVIAVWACTCICMHYIYPHPWVYMNIPLVRWLHVLHNNLWWLELAIYILQLYSFLLWNGWFVYRENCCTKVLTCAKMQRFCQRTKLSCDQSW